MLKLLIASKTTGKEGFKFGIYRSSNCTYFAGSVCSVLSSSWVNNFGHEGLGLLLDALEKLLEKKQ